MPLEYPRNALAVSLEFFESNQASTAEGSQSGFLAVWPSRSQVKDLLSSEAPSADAGPFLAVREHKRLGCPPARLGTPEYAWAPESTREHSGVP